ncbi:polysaccharide deacetylase family protein [Fusibacter paucivorans]|uniref:Polysaccharide deacetylase family protein n=1 Tax=Fusibacter paucivorans TaxID=76009 RepID=A0ABS5PM57_9FIRM|nr:polysaccharide deacetylase family protein [Fusibacter paucivorans]MBS7525676.1 polysaccharide deacetylase family protein [Fusibacter paucivorans]
MRKLILSMTLGLIVAAGSLSTFASSETILPQFELTAAKRLFRVESQMKTSVEAEKHRKNLKAWRTERAGVNELGKTMIIMYHRIGDDNSYYTRSVEAFKADLQRLYDEGYSLASMQSYLSGRIEVPFGRTPVILTFDDGDISNFRYLDDGSIDPNCAVGIINAFSEAHPAFGRHAVFYLNKDNPFGQPSEFSKKAGYILENGYEFGNHTMHHTSLKALTSNEIKTAIGGNANYFESLLPAVHFRTIALPFGDRPQNDQLYSYVFSGTYEDKPYDNRIALLVGWRPEKPLYAFETTLQFVNRVQSGDNQYQLGYWLDYFVDHPDERFISDGDPDIISVPAASADSYYGDMDVLEIIKPFHMGG